jgi:hypothetical protein
VFLMTLVVHGLSVSASPSTSTAQYKPTAPAALAHFEAGNRLYKSGLDKARPFVDRVRDLRGAIEEYRAGASVEDAPAFDFNIGHASVVLVDNRTAVEHLQRFLSRAHPDEPLRAKLVKEIEDLDPTGEVRADLRRSEERAQAAKGDPVVVPAPPPAPAPTIPLPPPVRSEPPNAIGEPGHGWVWLGWGLTAAALVGGGVTTWLAVSATGIDSDAKDTTQTTSDRVNLENRADSRRRTALIVGVGSGAAVVLGIVTLAIPARRSGSSPATAWNLGLTGNGVVVFGRF